MTSASHCTIGVGLGDHRYTARATTGNPSGRRILESILGGFCKDFELLQREIGNLAGGVCLLLKQCLLTPSLQTRNLPWSLQVSILM
jgi:hypothetical protein